MKNKKQIITEVAVGIFSFAMILVLLALTTVLSEEKLFRTYYPLEVVFDSVKDLAVGHAVMVRGVPVGKIQEIGLQDHQVRVKARLDQPLVLHEGYRIQIQGGSLIGGNVLNIYEGDPAAPRLPPDAQLRGTETPDLMSTAAKTVQRIQQTLSDDALEDIQVTLAQIRKVVTRLGEGEGTLGRLMTDDAIYGDVQQITANLKGISERLARGDGTLGRLPAEDNQAYEDLTATLAAFRQMTEAVANGEGTLGKLVADEELYLHFKALLREGRAAVDDMRETSPITTFTSVFFGIF